MTDAELEAAAKRARLQVRWTDATGEPRRVSPGTLRQLLPLVAAPGDGDSAPPLVTADVGRPVDLPAATATGAAQLVLEHGETRDVRVRLSSSGPRLPPIDRPGYHRLQTTDGEIIVAAAPRRAFTAADAAPARLWGLGVQVYAVRDEGSPDYGDFGALGRLAAATGRAGASLLATSPVHALFAADPSRFSPYAPSTRLFLNGLLADPRAVFPEAQPPAGASATKFLEPAKVWPARLAWLGQLHRDFAAERDGPRRVDFDRFRREGGSDLKGHAVFEALHARFFHERKARGWADWPQAYRSRSAPAVAAFAREQRQAVDLHIFIQWLARRSLGAAQQTAQAAGMPIGLVADLAVGMDPGGSHAWSRPDDLIGGASIGAPPDVWARAGQDWGIAAFSPAALRAGGYVPFLATLRAALADAGGVRIDHAMGLQRLWLVPRGASAAEGAYLSYPLDDLIRLLALESHRARAVVIAEDLGTVPEGFRQILQRRGIMGMQVLWFERTRAGGFRAPQRWSARSAALTTTHDLPTAAGWWRGRDIDWTWRLGRRSEFHTQAEAQAARAAERRDFWRAAVRARAADGPEPSPDQPERAVDAAIGLVARTPAAVTLVAAEDLAGLPEQPNLPGTLDEHPNWRRRLPSTQALLGEAGPRRRLALLNRERPRP